MVNMYRKAAGKFENRTQRYTSQGPQGPSLCMSHGTVPLTFEHLSHPSWGCQACTNRWETWSSPGGNQGCSKPVCTSYLSTPSIPEGCRPLFPALWVPRRRAARCDSKSVNTQGPGSSVHFAPKKAELGQGKVAIAHVLTSDYKQELL